MMQTAFPNSPFTYPSSRTGDHVDLLHGQEIPDPYRWLEDIDSPETRTWVEEQAALTGAYLSQLPERDAIRQRMTELWNYEKFGVPETRAGRIFFTINDGLQNQASLYWIEAGQDTPRLLLDPNTLSEDGTVALTGYSVSKDGQLLAYGLSGSGSDWQEWRFRQVGDGADLPDVLTWVKFSGAEWTHDNQGIFYSRYDAPTEGQAYKGANYYHKLYYHRLGTAQEADPLVYERPDQKEWGFGGQVSEDGRYLLINVWLGTHRENGFFYKDLTTNDTVVELFGDFDASYTYLGNDGTRFYFMTDLDAPTLRVVAIDLAQPERSHWEEVLPAASDTLESASLLHERFIGIYLHDAHSQVRIFDKRGQHLDTVDLPGIGTVLGFAGHQSDQETYYLFTGFTTPAEIYRYDLSSNQSTLFRRPRLLFNPADYETRQVFYPSKDGTRIPMFLVHKKGLQPGEDTPAYLYGYGGFNIAQTPAFSVPNLVWMEMGGLYALANLRGGGEYGKDWHTAGMRHTKQNVFDDFIAAGEWLVANGYTSPRRLSIGGRSNGGLLTGACLTQRPDLFGAGLVIVGVLDMLRFHKFTIGWAWVSDYGSPDDPQDFAALLAYSPYHNVKPGTAYPPILVATGDHDDRVFPAHSFKFAAALQHAQAGSAPVLIRIDLKAGHGLGKPTFKLIEESADLWAFLRYHLVR